jgi:DNA repair protein RecO (recombination protein O)
VTTLVSEALVLVRYPLTESSWLVSLFTREEGRVRAVAQGARRARSPFRGSLEPMNRVEAELRLREGRELARLSRADLLEGALDLFRNWSSAQVLLAVAEVLERGLPEHHAEEETFRLTTALMRGFREGLDGEMGWTYFVAWFLRLHGMFPRPDRCVSCGSPPAPLHFDAGAGGWLCPACRAKRPEQGLPVDEAARGLLDALFGGPPAPAALRGRDPQAVRTVRSMVYLALVAYLGRPLAAAPEFERRPTGPQRVG